MRIAYLAHLNQGRGSGVVAKVVGQVSQWRAGGHPSRLFVATRDVDLAWTEMLGERNVVRYAGFASRLAGLTRLVRAIRAFAPDVVYLRWDLFYPQLLWLPRGRPVVIEVNTDDVSEYALGRRLRAAYNAVTRRLLLRRAAALVFVTAELSERASFRRARSRRVVISNGIDLAEYPVLPGPSEGPPTLAFVGGGGEAWQGVDKVLELARLRPAWQFDVIGQVDPTPPATANVRFDGRLERAGLLEILARADVGLGTLALHRKDLSEASPLKAREYVAVGLPVVYGHADPDLDRLGSLVLRIANTPTNVVDELDRITAFVEGARGLRVPRAALDHLTVQAKEEQRLALFASVAHR